jgi:hypothetical protein
MGQEVVQQYVLCFIIEIGVQADYILGSYFISLKIRDMFAIGNIRFIRYLGFSLHQDYSLKDCF